jgi:hypothetical protein
MISVRSSYGVGMKLCVTTVTISDLDVEETCSLLASREDGTLDWEYIRCDLSDSLLDIPQFIDDMKYVGYDRYISIEDFRQIPHEEKLGGQISYLRSLIS